MTNEELICRYYDGDYSALTKLYNKNSALIRSIAKETAALYGCIIMDERRPDEYSSYTKIILDDLCAEGAEEFISRLQRKEYDGSTAMLTTYIYPHLHGCMRRWLENNIGTIALKKDEMDSIRKAQSLYHTEYLEVPEIASKLGISERQVREYIAYNSHFLGVYDLVPEDYDGDPFERLMQGKLSAPAEQIVYRKVCIELLRELFNALPKKDRDILGKCYGVFGFPKTPLKDIGMYHMMKEAAVEKAKDRAIKKLEKAYPGSRLQLWKTVHHLLRRPVLPPAEDSELRVSFPQHVRTLAELYGVLHEAATEVE